MPLISFNGERREVSSSTIDQLLEEFSLGEERIAVELNRAIISRSKFESTPLKDGDVIEIVQFVGGG